MSSIFRRKRYGMSLVEILGATAVVMTVASVTVISVKDTLTASQRSAVQRELQSLNSALNNFKATGGVIAHGSSAEDAVRAMRGVGVNDMDYQPLINDPDWLKQIGGETYRLDYNDESGFSYIPDSALSATFTDGGREANQPGAGGYQFDPTNPGEIASALDRLASLNPEDPEYAAILRALNDAAELGALSADDLMTAGLVEYNGEWMPPQAAQFNHAQDAQDLMVSGTPWTGLSSDQQSAYANLYPQAAVQAGGGEALNVMDPSLLTRELVQGYGNVGGQWLAPTAFGYAPVWTGWGSSAPTRNYHFLIPSSYFPENLETLEPAAQQYIYIQLDPLGPAVYAGSLYQVFFEVGPWQGNDGITHTHKSVVQAELVEDASRYAIKVWEAPWQGGDGGRDSGNCNVVTSNIIERAGGFIPKGFNPTGANPGLRLR